MKLRIINKVIYSEDGLVVGVISNDAPEVVSSSIEAGSEAVEAIKDFVSDVNSGKLKPRKSSKEFERILISNKIDL